MSLIADPLALLHAHLKQQPEVKIEFDPWTAFALMATLQLVLRHPGFAERVTARPMRELKDSLIGRLAAGDAAIEALLKAGDNPQFDEPRVGESSIFRRCRVCGCTDAHACIDGGVPCHWVADDLCSACDQEASEAETVEFTAEDLDVRWGITGQV